MLKGIADELGFRDVLGWRNFLARSPAHRAEMANAGSMLPAAAVSGVVGNTSDATRALLRVICTCITYRSVNASLHPTCNAAPAHKFGFALDWLKEFASPRWDDYAVFIKDYPAPASARSDADGTNFATLRTNMLGTDDAVYARAAVRIGWDLCKSAVPLLQDASKEARPVLMDYL